MTVQKTWKDISAAKIAARDAKIPAEWKLKAAPSSLNVMDVPRTCGILSDRELEITETPAVDLVAAMVAKRYTAQEVAVAFCKRAAIAQQLTNCLSEIFFEDGIAQAKAIDDEYAQTGRPRGPMHGLPISLKDAINYPGVDSSAGFIAWCNDPAKPEDEADQVTVLRKAGAVFYCKTNVPTGMLMGDSYNNVFGVTVSPFNTEYGAGGSSGGESALLAMRGSPLGIGSDIGGSIRMPSAITGLYGLKAAAGRFSGAGCKTGLPGQEAVKGVQGPMSPDLSSLELWSRVVLESRPWERDWMVYPVPWKEDVAVPEKLCFGIMRDDGVVRPTPPVVRALNETKAALEAAGHKVVEYTPYEPRQGLGLLVRLLAGDGGETLNTVLKGGEYPEPWPKDMEMFSEVYEKIKDSPPTVNQLWKVQAERQAYMRKFVTHWTETRAITGTGRPIDGLIAPALAFPAAPSLQFKHFGYTCLFNLADYCGVAFPVTKASKDDVVTEEITDFRCPDEKQIYSVYDADRLDGQPVGLQLVLPRHQEEYALKLTGVAAEALKQATK